VGPAAATHEVVEHVDGGDPLGVLSVGPVAATTKDVEDVDGGPPRGCCRLVQQ
jgi:hypothetical protein